MIPTYPHVSFNPYLFFPIYCIISSLSTSFHTFSFILSHTQPFFFFSDSTSGLLPVGLSFLSTWWLLLGLISIMSSRFCLIRVREVRWEAGLLGDGNALKPAEEKGYTILAVVLEVNTANRALTW